MTLKRAWILFALWALVLTSCQKKNYSEYLQLAHHTYQAVQEGDYSGALKYARRRLNLSPWHPGIHYTLASLYALEGQPDEAMASLKHALKLGFDFGDSLEPELRFLENDSEVKRLIRRMKTPVNSSQVAVRIPLRDLIPEGMAYNPLDGSFFMSSLEKCKIICFDLKGNISDFTEEKADDLHPVVGMKVDVKRRVFWAASELSTHRPDFPQEEVGWSALYKYDLDSGALIKRYLLYKEGERHLLNDIAITSGGDVYVSDSEFSAVYRVLAHADTLELFIKSDSFFEPNGIALGEDDQTLYLSSWALGVHRIEIPTKKYRLVAHPDDITLMGIDGLYFYKNSLVAVQNGLARVARFYLSEEGQTVTRLKVLETRNPHFNIPTTGAVAGDDFYYIANSQMASRKSDGSLDWDRLTDVVVLKTRLGE